MFYFLLSGKNFYFAIILIKIFFEKRWGILQLSDATRKRIKQLLKQNNMKLWDLSKAAGISLPTISDFLKNDTKNSRMLYYVTYL